MAGLLGTGKSTLASLLADALGGMVLNRARAAATPPATATSHFTWPRNPSPSR